MAPPRAGRRVSGPPALLAGAVAAALLAGAALDPRPRAAQVLVLVAMVAALGWTGARLARRLLPAEDLLTRALFAAELAIALATLLATALGHLGALRPGLFLLLVALCFAVSLGVPIAADPGEETGDPPEAPPPARSTPRQLSLRVRLERGLLLAAAIALCGALAVEVARAVDQPHGLYGPDDLSYHLPAVAVWQRFADLRMLKFSVGDRSTSFYPIVPELGAWTLLAPLRDSDVAARRTQVLFALLSLAAVASLARRLGLGWRQAALAVLVYLTFERAFPVLAWSAGNDHEAAFFTLAALDGALLLLARPSRGAALYTGLGLGLVAGSKYIGLYFAATVAAVLGLGLAARAVRVRRRAGAAASVSSDSSASSAGFRDLGSQLAILAAAALVTGGYAYLRNAWTAGNPVFPAPVGLFGHALLPGWKEATLAWRRHLSVYPIEPIGFLLRRADVFGPLFPYTVLAGSVLAAPYLLLRRRPLVLVAVAALPAVFYLQFVFLMHDHREARYILAALALGALDLAWLLESEESAWIAALRALCLVAIFDFACRRMGLRHERELALLLAAVALGPAIGSARHWRRPSFAWSPVRLSRSAGARWTAAALAIALALLVAWPLGAAVATYQAGKLTAEPAAAALERSAGPAGARVAYVGSNQPYLFFGSRLQNEVEIVPRTWDLAAQYYRWGGRVEFPFDDGNRRRWRRILDQLGVTLVVAVRSDEEGPERGWLESDPGDFKLLYDDGATEIWRVVG